MNGFVEWSRDEMLLGAALLEISNIIVEESLKYSMILGWKQRGNGKVRN